MGRPLSKKHFGNTGPSGLGGEGVASVVLSALGNYTTRPVFTFSGPQIVGGVTATGTVTSEANLGTISGTQTKAYQVGQVLTAANGSTWTVSTITTGTTISTVIITGTGGQFSCGAATLTVGQSVTISGTYGGTGSITGYSNPTTYYIGATNGTTTFTLVSSYAAAISGTGGAIVTAAGTPTGLTYTVNSVTSRVVTVTVANRSSFEATLTGTAMATTSVAGGEGVLITSTYRAKAVVITLAGSGYTSSPTATPTESVTFTSVALSTTTANAITNSSFIPAANGGSSAVAGDIVRQVNTRSYKVTTAQGTGICKLVAAAPTAGQMTIAATDANGSTYYVTKLTARKATLTRNVVNGLFLFATGSTAQWGLGAAAGVVVQVANA